MSVLDVVVSGRMERPADREDAGPPHYAVPGMYYEKVYSKNSICLIDRFSINQTCEEIMLK